MSKKPPKKRRKRYAPIDDISRNEVMAAIRDLYWEDPEACDREMLLVLLRDHLGLGALGKHIRDELSGDIRTAVRRGILDNTDGQYTLICRHIGQYDRDFLREMLLAAIGRNWIDRDDAIRQTARHLGFRRTGPNITKAARSAINSALRRKELQREGTMIRRK